MFANIYILQLHKKIEKKFNPSQYEYGSKWTKIYKPVKIISNSDEDNNNKRKYIKEDSNKKNKKDDNNKKSTFSIKNKKL